ncbi:mitochondrial outer membrane import complex protein METAXIN-like isoform X2 [Vicia villosa]|uniref:mitochondrial outer membrane import complex protein METAXIN-like isoform X2 n=1 Tax=Vicia villosa TaxID=3911 RepID=UPI00273B544A|nr:mitochondrial outer membrane import complex protein METAXIN-like isoform X2 [Vicia villosa]
MAEIPTLVVRKPCFDLPTGCPQCLSAYIYLNFAKIPFQLNFHLNDPHSDKIPYFEVGDEFVAYDNENEGIIQFLRKNGGVVDLDSEVCSLPEWIAIKAVVTTWLHDALVYELWLESKGSAAYSIYYSDLPWPIGKVLSHNKVRSVKVKHGITDDNAVAKKEEIYERANSAYDALSKWLGEKNYLFGDSPSSLDAIFLAHGLVALQALPESSALRIKFLEHDNLVRYVRKCKTEIIEAGPQIHTDASSSGFRIPSTQRHTSKSAPKREKTDEEKRFKRKGRYFVAAQLVAVAVFLTLMMSFDFAEVEGEKVDGGRNQGE